MCPRATTTRADYRQSIECYIAPRIGGVRLEQLTPEHLNRLYRALEQDDKRRGPCRTDGRACPVEGCSPSLHEGLKPKSIRDVHGCLHVALEAAVQRGYLSRNVADLANPPTPKRARSRNARDRCWTRDQLVAFLEHSRGTGDPLCALWFLIATTGLRRAETLALRWTDLDLDQARLTIRQTVTVAAGRPRDPLMVSRRCHGAENAPDASRGRSGVLADSRCERGLAVSGRGGT